MGDGLSEVSRGDLEDRLVWIPNRGGFGHRSSPQDGPYLVEMNSFPLEVFEETFSKEIESLKRKSSSVQIKNAIISYFS